MNTPERKSPGATLTRATERKLMEESVTRPPCRKRHPASRFGRFEQCNAQLQDRIENERSEK